MGLSGRRFLSRRVSPSRARSFLRPLLPSAYYAGYVGRLKCHITIESSLVFTRNVTKKGSAFGHILKVWDPEMACSE